MEKAFALPVATPGCRRIDIRGNLKTPYFDLASVTATHRATGRRMTSDDDKPMRQSMREEFHQALDADPDNLSRGDIE